MSSESTVEILRDIPKFRVLVAEVSLLSIIESIQSLIPSSRVSHSVLAEIVCDAKTSHTEYNNLGAEIDAMTDRISRCVTNKVGPSTRMSINRPENRMSLESTHVASTPPRVPIETIQAVATARTAGPAESAKD